MYCERDRQRDRVARQARNAGRAGSHRVHLFVLVSNVLHSKIFSHHQFITGTATVCVFGEEHCENTLRYCIGGQLLDRKLHPRSCLLMI